MTYFSCSCPPLMPTCLAIPKKSLNIQNDCSNSVSIFSKCSFHHNCPLTLKKRISVWILLFFWLIFQCYITIIPISVPSGFSTVYLSISSVSSNEHVCDKLNWWARRGKEVCLSEYHFLLSGRIKHSKWRKITFCGLPENAGSVLGITMWGTKFMRSATNYFINLLFPCEKSSNRLAIYFYSFCRFSGGLGSAGQRVGPDSLRGLFYPKLFYDSMICNFHIIFLNSCCRGTKKNHFHFIDTYYNYNWYVPVYIFFLSDWKNTNVLGINSQILVL